MRIAFVCNEYPPLPHGGIGTFVETMATALSHRGHDVTVVGFGDRSDERVQQGVRVVEMRRTHLRFAGNIVSRFRLRSWLQDQIHRGRFDVIEVPDFQGTLPFKLTGCPVIVRLHLSFSAISLQAGRKPSLGVRFYERQTLKCHHNWIAVSECILDITKRTFGTSPKRVAIVYNPVPSTPADDVEMPALPREFVLFAGALSRRKGAVVLAEAAREFLRSHSDIHLVYVGGDVHTEGDQPVSHVIREIVGSELSSRVHLLGHRDRSVVIQCMKRARVFAFPSQLEALPLVVLEAMNCRLPVVCTSDPPGPEIIEDGFNGLLADPRSPKDLSNRISILLDSPDIAQRVADNAVETINSKFSLDRCIRETERFYTECTQAEAPGIAFTKAHGASIE